MNPIYEVRRDLVVLLQQTPSFEALKDLFAARTHEWKYPHMEVEGGGIGLFTDLLRSLETHQAFSLIDDSLKIALEQNDGQLFATALSLVVELASASTTTEMPPELARSWNALGELDSRLAHPEAEWYLKELRRWYRFPLSHNIESES